MMSDRSVTISINNTSKITKAYPELNVNLSLPSAEDQIED